MPGFQNIIQKTHNEGMVNMVKNTLYYENAYIEKFESIVKECIKENEKIKVVLENTAFYPEGGGQPSDTGVIDDVKVLTN